MPVFGVSKIPCLCVCVFFSALTSALGIPESTIKMKMKYWEQSGVIISTTDDWGATVYTASDIFPDDGGGIVDHKMETLARNEDAAMQIAIEGFIVGTSMNTR